MDLLDVTAKLKDVLDAETRALDNNDMVAYEALCINEARLMDILKASWRDDG